MAKAKARGRVARFFILLLKGVGALVAFSVLWVFLYALVPVPVTATMLMDEKGIDQAMVERQRQRMQHQPGIRPASIK